ncbi:primase C-terminal domain-containing protein, partial [Vibrio cholerae]|uniref:primase C-terminal domain-containing protein n=1 Tax=Vibrio cholerae TaxID=666 RepID=UPI000A3F9AEF
QFKQPLPENEVKHTAKSVAKWTHKHFSPSAFSAWQAKQGAKGGKISKGGGRPVGTVNSKSLSQTKPWEDLGISRATYYRQKKES